MTTHGCKIITIVLKQTPNDIPTNCYFDQTARAEICKLVWLTSSLTKGPRLIKNVGITQCIKTQLSSKMFFPIPNKTHFLIIT